MPALAPLPPPPPIAQRRRRIGVPERLDYESMARVVGGLTRMVEALFGPSAPRPKAAPREAVDRSLQLDKLTRRALLPGAADPDLVRKVTERLAAARPHGEIRV